MFIKYFYLRFPLCQNFPVLCNNLEGQRCVVFIAMYDMTYNYPRQGFGTR